MILALSKIFSQTCREKAIKETGDRNIDAAVDWLTAHQDDYMSVEEPAQGASAPAEGTDVKEAGEKPVPVAKSIKCDE